MITCLLQWQTSYINVYSRSVMLGFCNHAFNFTPFSANAISSMQKRNKKISQNKVQHPNVFLILFVNFYAWFTLFLPSNVLWISHSNPWYRRNIVLSLQTSILTVKFTQSYQLEETIPDSYHKCEPGFDTSPFVLTPSFF